MSDDSGLKIKVTADTKPAEESLDQFGDKATNLGKKLAAGLAGYLSFQAVKEVLTKSIDAAVESDRAVKEFNNSLAITGKYTEQLSQSFQDYAGQLQRATGVTDEAILKGASSLVTLGKVAPENLQKVSAATLDLASAMQVDAGTAFDIMTKAANGNVMALKRFGITASEGGTAAEKFASIVGKIEGQIGGLAARNLDPFTKFKVSLDELYESIGKMFTKNPAFKAAITIFARQLDILAEKFTALGNNKAVISDFIRGFFALGEVLSKYIIAPLETLYRFIVVGTKTIIMALSGIVEAAATVFGKVDLAKGAKEIREKFWNELGQEGTQATDAAQNTAANYVGIFSETAADSMRVSGGKAGLAFSSGLTDYFKSTEAEIAETTNQMGENIVNAVVPPEDAEIKWGNFFDGFTGGSLTFVERIDAMNKALVGLGKQAFVTLTAGFSSSFAAMGKALVKGGNLLDAFAQSMLGVLGDLALQMSTFFIAQGVALLFSVGGTAQGTALIAAGAALGVVGGVLKALGGGGGGAETGAGVPSTAADVGGSNLSNGLAGPQERNLPTTGVQVVVQGNILNTRESALEIAQVLNDSFDTNGTFIRATG